MLSEIKCVCVKGGGDFLTTNPERVLQIQVLLQIPELFLSRLEQGGGINAGCVWAQHLKVRVRVPGMLHGL